MELQLKYLAPYLPYRLKGLSNRGSIFYLGTYSNMRGTGIEDKEIAHWLNDQMKPILRPLSDLTKEIEINGEKFVPTEWFEIGEEPNESFDYGFFNCKIIADLEITSKYNVTHDINFLPFSVVQKLFEWHFDVFNGIEDGWAIDINSLKE